MVCFIEIFCYEMNLNDVNSFAMGSVTICRFKTFGVSIFARIISLSFRCFSVWRPWAVGQNYFVSWHLSGGHLVHGLFERKIDILLPKEVPKQKTYLFKLYHCKRCEIIHSTITKWMASSERAQKTTYETLKQVFIFRIVVLLCLKFDQPIFGCSGTLSINRLEN